MAKCANNELFKKIGQKLIDDMSEIEFVLQNELPNCRTINAGKYVSNTGTVSYSRFAVPDNMFECNPMACVNSGTLTVANSGVVTYKAQFDLREFAAGIMTFYVKGNGAAGTVKVDISETSTFTNANSMTLNYPATTDYVPMLVEFNKFSDDDNIGTGWTPSANGAFIRFTFGTGAEGAGLSSISLFQTYEDFATTDVVKIGCLTDISGTIDIPAITRQCSTASYDTSNLSFTRTINGKLLTPNYHKLNPLFGKGVQQDGAIQHTVRQTVANDGTVIISDMNLDECGAISAQRTDVCESDLAMLTRLYSPVLLGDPDEGHFQVITDEANGTATFHFATALAGKEVLISYPKKIAVERYAANVNNVGDVRVMARFNGSYVDNRGSMDVVYTLPNVLITSFPWNITRTEQDFSFTISIQPDADGNYYYMDKVVL